MGLLGPAHHRRLRGGARLDRRPALERRARRAHRHVVHGDHVALRGRARPPGGEGRLRGGADGRQLPRHRRTRWAGERRVHPGLARPRDGARHHVRRHPTRGPPRPPGRPVAVPGPDAGRGGRRWDRPPSTGRSGSSAPRSGCADRIDVPDLPRRRPRRPVPARRPDALRAARRQHRHPHAARAVDPHDHGAGAATGRCPRHGPRCCSSGSTSTSSASTPRPRASRKVTQYVRGHERYESAPTWPVPGLTASRWYLHGTGGLDPAAPPAGAPGRSYLALPITGTCTRSTSQWLIGLVGPPCATDNRIDEQLSLTYTSEPFAAGAGDQRTRSRSTSGSRPSSPMRIVSVAVSDVAPDGTSLGLSNGLLLASHRAVDPSRSRMLDGQSIQPWHPFTQDAVTAVTSGRADAAPDRGLPHLRRHRRGAPAPRHGGALRRAPRARRRSPAGSTPSSGR